MGFSKGLCLALAFAFSGTLWAQDLPPGFSLVSENELVIKLGDKAQKPEISEANPARVIEEKYFHVSDNDDSFLRLSVLESSGFTPEGEVTTRWRSLDILSSTPISLPRAVFSRDDKPDSNTYTIASRPVTGSCGMHLNKLGLQDVARKDNLAYKQCFFTATLAANHSQVNIRWYVTSDSLTVEVAEFAVKGQPGIRVIKGQDDHGIWHDIYTMKRIQGINGGKLEFYKFVGDKGRKPASNGLPYPEAPQAENLLFTLYFATGDKPEANPNGFPTLLGEWQSPAFSSKGLAKEHVDGFAGSSIQVAKFRESYGVEYDGGHKSTFGGAASSSAIDPRSDGMVGSKTFTLD